MARQKKATEAKTLERALSAQEYIESVLASDPWIAYGLARLLADEQLNNYLQKQCNATAFEFISTSDTNRQDEILQHIKNYFIKKQYGPTGNKAKNSKGEEYDKYGWKRPLQFFISVAVSYAEKDRVEDKIKLSFSKTPEYCDICGTKEQVIESKRYIYPFAITLDKFANFYSNMTRSFKLCRRCVASGLAAFDTCMYHVGKDRVNLFFFETDLETLKELIDNFVIPIKFTAEKLNKNNSNFYLPSDQDNSRKLEPIELYETLFTLLVLMFLEKISYKYANLSLNIHMLSAKSSGNVFSVDAREEFRDYSYMFELYELVNQNLQASGIYEDLLKIFSEFVFIGSKGKNTYYREKLCKMVISKKDITEVVEGFLYKVLLKQKINLSKAAMIIVETYLKHVMGVDEKLLKAIKSYAYNLAKEVYNQNKVSHLYRLKNSHNVLQLLDSLNMNQFTFSLPVNSLILYSITKNSIIDYGIIKRLISIYAANFYLIALRTEEAKKSSGKSSDAALGEGAKSGTFRIK